MYVAWCTPIEAGHKNMHVLEGKDGIFLEQNETAEPMVVKTAAAMFHNVSVSSNDHLATRKIFGHIGLRLALQEQFKSRSEAFHKAKANAVVRSMQKQKVCQAGIASEYCCHTVLYHY